MRALLLLACVLSLSGCAAAVVGAAAAGAGYLYVDGAATEVLAADMAAVERATRRAFDELGLVAVDGSGDGLELRLRATMSDGRTVRVVASPVDDGTRVRVRVGVLGDEALGRQVLRHIREALEPDDAG